MEFLNAGDAFEELPETVVIFICNHDPYAKGKRIYYVDRVVRDEQGNVISEYGDRQHILYVNGDWRGKDDLGKLMHDFHCGQADQMYFPQVAERMNALKNTEGGKMYLTGVTAELYKDALEEAQEQVREEWEREKAEREREKADWEREKAELERKKAELECEKAELERENAERMLDSGMEEAFIAKMLAMPLERVKEIAASRA